MKKQILFALLLIFCSLQAKEIKETQRLVWPPAPSEAKIEYAFSFTKQEDLKIEKGFFTKIWEFFAGSDDRALMKPFGMHTHGKRIYVTDIGARALFVFDRKKKKMEIIEGAKEQRFVSPRFVLRVSGPDLPLHPSQPEAGVLCSLDFIVAETENPDAHVEDGVQSEHHEDHQHHGDQYLGERETTLFS